MTTEITPIKRLSTGINEFRNNVKAYYKEINLNKSTPKYNAYAWRDDKDTYSKGVESDFIMIFNPNVLSHVRPSFAIAFTFLGLPLEKQRVEITIKKGVDNNSIVTSGELTVEEFKTKLKEINKAFQEKSYLKNRDETAIIEKVSDIFLSQHYDLRGEIKQATKDLAKLREQKRKEFNIENLENNVVTTTNDYDNAEKKAKKAINNSSEKNEVDKLESLLAEAIKNLHNKTDEVNNKYKLKDLKEDKNDAKTNLVEASDNMNKAVQIEIDKLPGIVGRRMKM